MIARRVLPLGFLVLAVACGGSARSRTPGGFPEVAVVLTGAHEPLPFDPRGGRLSVVTGEIGELLGHPVVLELDAALSPDLRASLEETVIASFEELARELVGLRREDAELFERARRLERIVCRYDAVAKESLGALEGGGKVLVVRAPPDRFPLLERRIVTRVLDDARIAEQEARFGDADPARLDPSEHAPYFAYLTSTRPGVGSLWIAARRARGARDGEALRVERVGRVVTLAERIAVGTSLEKDVRRFLLESASVVGGLQAEPSSRSGAVVSAYVAWLNRRVPSFDDEERLLLHRAVFERRQGICGGDCAPDAVLPGFDRFAFGLGIYDAWAKETPRGSVALPSGARGELYRHVVCPTVRRGEAETEIRYGCSAFFASILRDFALRGRLAETIAKRRDARLLEDALLHAGHGDGAHALALVEALGRDDALFRQGFGVLFHDHARRDDVKRALEEAAPRWWRDAPSRRGLALLVMARRWEGLHVHYGDNQWTRFVAEFGGPIGRDVFAAYLAEGPRAVEMAPKIWPALARTRERDDLVAKNLPVLLDRDREARSSRATPALALLRERLCGEKNAAGLEAVRASLERWGREHPSEAAAVSNARADLTPARCAAPPEASKD